MALKRTLLASIFALVAWAPAAPAMEMDLAGDTLFLHGSSITLDDWVRYRELTSGKKFSTVVLANQGGGKVSTALGIAQDLIQRRVTTIVLGYCNSACTYLFLAGERRQFGNAWPVGRTWLGFHGVYGDFVTSTPTEAASVASYYRSRLERKGWEVLENALQQFPDRRGLLRISHPSHGRDANLCAGSIDQKCQRIANIDAAALGLVTTTDLAAVSLPEKLVARDQLLGIELSTFRRFAESAELAGQCPQGAGACVRALEGFLKRPADRAAALSQDGKTGMGWSGSQPQRSAWRALYECVRVASAPCRLAAVNDYLTLDLYGVWAKESDEALEKLKTVASDKVAVERYDDAQAPMSQLKTGAFNGATPKAIPGVKEVSTRELLRLLGAQAPTLIDVWCADVTLPSAKCTFGAGLAFTDPARDQALEKIFLVLLDAMVPDRQAPIVLFSVHSNNWLSANAAFRAAKGGRNILWYRGGLGAWQGAGLPTVQTAPFGAVTE